MERKNHYQKAVEAKSVEELGKLLCYWECNCETCNKRNFCAKGGSKENGWIVFLRRFDYQLESDMDFMEGITD